MIDLAAIEARCNAATPSPWEAHSGKTDKGTPWNEVHSPCPCCGLIATTHPIAGADDAAFIAYARTDIPALIERVRELEGEVIEWKERHKQAALNWQQENQENAKLQDQLHNAEVHADCMEARAIAFEAELSKSHARERAAVADLTEILSKNELNICTFCKRYHKDCGCYMDDDTCDAVWRGQQEDGLCG